MINQRQFAQYLRQHIDWCRVFTLLQSVGPSMNARDMLALKGKLVVQALKEYGSSGLIDIVDEDGCDIIATLNGTRIKLESKSVQKLFKNKRQEELSTFTYSNARPSSSGSMLPIDGPDELPKSDYVIMVSPNACGLLNSRDVVERSKRTSSGRTVSDFPVMLVEWIAKSNELLVQPQPIDMSRRIDQLLTTVCHEI